MAALFVCAAAHAEPAAFLAEIDGRIVARHAEREARQPASLAKLATALLVLRGYEGDSTALRDTIVSVSARAAATPGTRLGLQAGDRARLRDLLDAMLIGSANDACLALVEHASGGDVRAFARRMNRLAQELGMLSSHFVDPCGHDRPGQYSTASDLLKLAHAALADATIPFVADRADVQVVLVEGDRTLWMRSTNAMLGRYPGVFGLKTGYTAQAGGCVIAAAQLQSSLAIVVVLGSRQRWTDAATLLDRTFDGALPIPRARTPNTIGEPD